MTPITLPGLPAKPGMLSDYSAEQMQAYARAAVEQQVADPAQAVVTLWNWYNENFDSWSEIRIGLRGVLEDFDDRIEWIYQGAIKYPRAAIKASGQAEGST